MRYHYDLLIIFLSSNEEKVNEKPSLPCPNYICWLNMKIEVLKNEIKMSKRTPRNISHIYVILREFTRKMK